jgi:peptidoglycan/LPS O-acetylase OafA/YrhL
MSNTITNSKENNNFNIIRIYLSLSVLMFHSHVLSQKKELSFLSLVFNADRAVQAFFIISGYLVVKSYQRSDSNKAFFIKRLKRIYPGYLAVILLCALGGAYITSYSIADYFTSPALYKYLLANISFLNFIQPSLPGVFDGNFLPAVNGSLWTLKIEVGFYLLVPLLLFFKRKMNVHFLYGGVFFLSVGFYLGMLYLYNTSHKDMYLFLSRQIPGQLFYFIPGAWVGEMDNKPWFKSLISRIGFPCILVLFLPLGAMAGSLALAFVVFFFAFSIPAINYPFKQEDISYGLYIYHFPVIQTLVYYGVYNRSAALGVLLSVACTVILAILSWVFIEKRFIIKRVPATIVSERASV